MRCVILLLTPELLTETNCATIHYTTWELQRLYANGSKVTYQAGIPRSKVKGHPRLQFLLFDSARFKPKFGVFGQKIKKLELLKDGAGHVKNRNLQTSNGRNY